MEMTIREYAEAVKTELTNGINGTIDVVDVAKANNVVFTGLRVKFEGINVSPTVYVDSSYEGNLPVDEAANQLMKIIKAEENKLKGDAFNMDWIYEYENVKTKLRARLYNKKTEAEVKMSAKTYGFDDLIIVPYIELDMKEMGSGAIKVTNKMLKMWNVTKQDVITTALANSAEEAKVQDLLEVLAEMNGIPVELIPPHIAGPRMLVIGNDKNINGAISIIAKLDYLKERFGEFYVVPSSVHEVIVYPVDGAMAKEDLEKIINEVNTTCVAPEEYLGDKAYHFAA